jgi:hypothetical protein
MDFFKHYVGAHRGESLQKIHERGGHAALSCYWILVALCAEKLPKDKVWTAGPLDCVFNFHERYLRDELRIKSVNLENYLRIFQECSQISFSRNQTSILISFPKLLETLDRGRKPRTNQTEIGCLDKEEDKERDKELEKEATKKSEVSKFEQRMKFDFQSLFSLHANPQKKTQSLNLLAEKVHDQETYDKLTKAVQNYSKFCALAGRGLQHRLTFPSFLTNGKIGLIGSQINRC